MNTTMEKTTTNGIDTTAQKQIMAMMQQQPQLAGITFQAGNEWLGATRSQTVFSNYHAAGQEHPHESNHAVGTDMPGLFLGTDQSPTPAEYALHALASCMNSTMVYNCAARGIEVRSSSVRIEGDLNACGFLRLDDDIPAGYSQIRVAFDVDADAPAEMIQDLIEGSPMFNTFSRPVPINVSLQMK